ncbi:MAG: 2H phosphoesterase superfamily protein Bsu1186 (yjcG), partial [uncultured Nocardioides sp.]
ADHRSSDPDPRAVGDPAPGLPHLRRRHHRRADPDPHHPDTARRGHRRRAPPRLRAPRRGCQLRRRVPHPPSRDRDVPTRLAGGVRDRRRGDLVLRGPGGRRTTRAAGGRPQLPLPPPRHHRPPPRRRDLGPGLRRAGRVRVRVRGRLVLPLRPRRGPRLAAQPPLRPRPRDGL